MDKIIAYCGLVCTDCQAYIATQANDLAALEQMAARAREQFNTPDITVESAMCDGCLTDEGHKCGYCSVCEIRACATMRPQSIANCAHCIEYAAQDGMCTRLKDFFARAPDARVMLDEVKRGLEEEMHKTIDSAQSGLDSELS